MNSITKTAAESYELLKLLFRTSLGYRYHALERACKNGHVNVVNYILQDQRLNMFDIRCALRQACKHGQLPIVIRIIKDARAFSEDHDNDVLNTACENNHLDIVEHLLRDSRIDPSRNNIAFQNACYFGHVKIADRLLRDDRTHVVECGQWLIGWLMRQNLEHIGFPTDSYPLSDPRVIFAPVGKCPGHNASGSYIRDCERQRESMNNKMYTARKAWYAIRSAKFNELHAELVAVVESHHATRF